MDELLEILNELDDSIDYETEEALIDDRIFTSFDVISLVAELESTFDIRIEAGELVPENFNSAQAILALVNRLRGEG